MWGSQVCVISIIYFHLVLGKTLPFGRNSNRGEIVGFEHGCGKAFGSGEKVSQELFL